MDDTRTSRTQPSETSSTRVKIVSRLLGSYPQTLAAGKTTYLAYVEATSHFETIDMARGVDAALAEHEDKPPTAMQFAKFCGQCAEERKRDARRALPSPDKRRRMEELDRAYRDKTAAVYGEDSEHYRRKIADWEAELQQQAPGYWAEAYGVH